MFLDPDFLLPHLPQGQALSSVALSFSNPIINLIKVLKVFRHITFYYFFSLFNFAFKLSASSFYLRILSSTSLLSYSILSLYSFSLCNLSRSLSSYNLKQYSSDSLISYTFSKIFYAICYVIT